jgi:uncharacterized protein YeaC (DUF1315 family)
VEGPAGASEADIMQVVRRQYLMAPAAAQPTEDKQGFMAGIRSGIENLKGDVGALGAGLGIEGGEAYARAQAAKAAELYQQPKFTEAPVDYVTGMLGQSLPYIAAPLAAGAAAAAAPLTGTAALTASLGAAGLASATQFTGSNLSRQLDEGRTTDTLELGNAALAAIPQAALDTLSLKLLPGIGRLFGTAGKELTEEAAQAAARAALAKGTGNLVKQYGGAVLKTAGIEGLTETGQQVLERAQAELEMLDPEARQEYLDSFIGGALLGGTLAAPGKAFERGADRRKLAEFDKRKADAEAAKTAQERAEYEKTDDYALEVATTYENARTQLGELEAQKRKVQKGSPTAEEDTAHNKAIIEQQKALREETNFKALAEQYKALGPRIEKVKRMTTMTPEDALAEDIGLPSVPTRDARVGGPRRRAVMSGAELPEGVDADAFPSAPLSPEERTPFYVEQQLRAATQRAKQAAVDANPELGMAGIDASEGVTLTGDQMIEALAEDPGQAMAVIQTRGALPGMSIPQANLIRAGLRSRLDQLGGEIGDERQQVAARRAEIEREIQALRDMRSRKDVTSIRERELQLELDEINKLAGMDTTQTAQGTLFPQDTLRSDIISGAGVVDGTPTRAKLEADLQLARVLSDKKAAERIIEELRALRESQAKEDTPRGTDTRELQEAFGSKQPQDVRRSQTASDARAVAYAKTVTLLDRFNKGKAKQNELDAAEQQVYNTLVNEIEALRGEPVTAMERTQITAAAKEQVQELKDRFGDTRNMVEVEIDGQRVLVPEDSPQAQGAVAGTAMGVARKEGRAPGQRTFGNRYAAAKSIEEGLNEIRNRYVAPKRGAGVERSLTPARITDEMLDNLVERVDPNRLSDADAAVFEQIQADLPGIKTADADGERATEVVGEYLYGLTTGNPSPTLRKEVQGILRSIDTAKRSETETTATGEVRRAVQGDMFADEIGTTFSDFLDFDNYMASTELAQVRDALELGGETQARAQKLVAPLEARAKAIQTEIARLVEQRDAARKAAEGSPEKAAADELVVETKKSLAELQADMDEALLPFNMAYWNTYAKLTEAKIASQAITDKIEANTRSFDEAISAIEKNQKQKDERVTKVRGTLKELQGYTSFYNAAKRRYDEAWDKLYGTQARVSQKTPEYEALVADRAEIERLQKQVQATHNKLITEMRSFWWTSNPEARRDQREVDALQADIDLQLQLRTISKRMGGLTTARNNAKRELDAALKALGADPELVQELNALRSDAAVAQEIRADVEAGIKTRLDSLVTPLQKQLDDLARQSDAMREAVARYRKGTQAKEQDTKSRNVRIEKKQEPKTDVQATMEKFLPLYSRSMVSFEKRRAATQDIINDVGPEKVRKLVEALETGTAADGMRLTSDERAYAAAELKALLDKVESRMEKRDATLQEAITKRTQVQDEINKTLFSLTQELLNQKELTAVEKGRKTREELEAPKRQKIETKLEALSKEIEARDNKIRRATGSTVTPIAKPQVAKAEREALTAETRTANKAAFADAEQAVKDAESDFKDAQKSGDTIAVKNARALLGEKRYALSQLNAIKNAAATRATTAATKKQSAEPRQLRTESAESRAGKNVTTPENKIEETRGAKQRNTTVSAKEMKAANKVAEALRDPKKEKNSTLLRKEVEKARETARSLKALFDESGFSEGDIDGEFASVVRDSQYDGRPTTELSGPVKADIRAGRLEDALLRLQDEGSTPFVRDLAKRLAPLVKNVTLVSRPDVVDSKGVPVEALYFGKDMQIQVNSTSGMTEEAFMHEVVHPATLSVLTADPATLNPEQRAARQEVEALFGRIQNDPKFSREYAKFSVAEMVSEIMSNNKLRNMLDDRGFLGRIYDAILRMLGIPPKRVSEQAVENIYALFSPAKPIAGVRVASIMRGVFPDHKPEFNTNVPASFRNGVMPTASDTKFGDKLSAFMLGMRTKAADQYAAREALLKLGLEGKKLDEAAVTQSRIYMRLNSDANRFSHQAMLDAPLALVKDEKGFFGVGVDEKRPGYAKVLETLRGVVGEVGNMEATEGTFYRMLQFERAETDGVGFDKMNMRKPPTAAEVRQFRADLAASPKLKAAFDKARTQYREYNNGMLDFVRDAGAFTDKEVAAFKKGNYVPYYRLNENTGNIDVVVGGTSRTIGNVINQPQLKELVGGEKDFLSLSESVLQNTQMLTRIALQNLQARDVGFMIQNLGLGKIIDGDGPANSIRFKLDGEKKWVKLDTDLFPKDIPAEILLQGLHGVKAAVPAALKMAGIPTNFLRATIVRMPLYIIRQMIRDPLHAWFTTGQKFTPVVDSIKELTKMYRGESETELKLLRSGAVSSNVMTGDYNDAARTLRDMSAEGKPWNTIMATLDNAALRADASTRAVLYDKYRQQGMSHFEAALGAAEVMNFTRRGTSSSLYMMSTLVPFFNAQIQGIDSIYRGVKGDTVFEKQLGVRNTLAKRAALMTGITLAYALAMQDEEAYKNATPQERAMNWFLPLPFTDAALRVPIPFEIGILTKAIPELLYNAGFGDASSGDTVKGLKYVLGMSVPSVIPTVAKPVLEIATNYSFFRDGPIETLRDKQVAPEFRYRESTTELAKLMGKATSKVGVSPLQIEHFVTGYASTAGLLALSMFNPILRPFTSEERGEKVDRRITETPFFGSAFQPSTGRGLVDSVYADVEDWQQAAGTFKNLVTSGRTAEARAFADKQSRDIALSSTGGSFKNAMGQLAEMRRAVEANPNMTGSEKRERIEEIKKLQIKLAAKVREMSAVE